MAVIVYNLYLYTNCIQSLYILSMLHYSYIHQIYWAPIPFQKFCNDLYHKGFFIRCFHYLATRAFISFRVWWNTKTLNSSGVQVSLLSYNENPKSLVPNSFLSWKEIYRFTFIVFLIFFNNNSSEKGREIELKYIDFFILGHCVGVMNYKLWTIQLNRIVKKMVPASGKE